MVEAQEPILLAQVVNFFLGCHEGLTKCVNLFVCRAKTVSVQFTELFVEYLEIC